MKKYTFSIGLNDQEAKIQLINTDDAKTYVARLMYRVFGGATIQDGRGVYVHENGQVVFENSLIVTVYDFAELPEKKYLAISELIRRAFNQEAVLLECQDVAMIERDAI